MEQWSFPALPPKDIVACLHDLELHVSEADLQKPTQALMRTIYMRLMEIVMYTSREELEQPNLVAMDPMEHPSLHTESIPVLTFLRKMQELMQVAQVHNFSLRDITRPTYNRTLYLLSAIINVVKFREDCLQKYQSWSARTAEFAYAKAAAIEKNEELHAKLRALHHQREMEEPQVRQLTQEVQELEAEVCKLNKHQAQLQVENVSLKEKAAELADHLSIKQMEATVEMEKQNLHQADNRTRELLSRLDSLQRIEKDVLKCTELLRACQIEKEKKKRHKAAIKEGESQITALQNILREIDNQEARLKRQVTATEEKIQKLEESKDAKGEAAQRMLDEVMHQRDAAEKENKAARSTAEANEEEVKRLKKKMLEVKEEHREEMEAMREQYEQFEVQVHDYHHRLFRAMKSL
ncbi:kinetochore-associated Ndc80 complex subunit nuf2 [Balamuthia mandrillaris]